MASERARARATGVASKFESRCARNFNALELLAQCAHLGEWDGLRNGSAVSGCS